MHLPGLLGLKNFGPAKLQVEKVWDQNIFFKLNFWTPTLVPNKKLKAVGHSVVYRRSVTVQRRRLSGNLVLLREMTMDY